MKLNKLDLNKSLLLLCLRRLVEFEIDADVSHTAAKI